MKEARPGLRRGAFFLGRALAARGLDMVGVLPKPVRVADLWGLLAQFKRDAEAPC